MENHVGGVNVMAASGKFFIMKNRLPFALNLNLALFHLPKQNCGSCAHFSTNIIAKDLVEVWRWAKKNVSVEVGFEPTPKL